LSQSTEAVREPWLGLASYQETDSELFYGRERETEELLRLLKREMLTVVFGPSGTGKTSLLNAGLFPRLRESGYLPIAIRLSHSGAAGAHTRQIRSLIGDALRASGIEEEALFEPHLAADDETLWEYLHRVEFWDPRNNAITPVFAFDQFEEVFTLGRNRHGTTALLAELADLVENYVPASVRSRLEKSGGKLPFTHSEQRFKILLSLREDYVPRLDSLRQAMPSVMHNRFALARMNGDQALIAVEKPGRGIVDETVSKQIVLFVAAANEAPGDRDADGASFKNLRVEPALLSVVCRELNARRIQEGRQFITQDLLEEAHTDILDAFYKRGFEGLDSNARVFVEDRLLTASGFRSTVPLEEASHAGVGEGEIRALVNRRLIRVEERLGIPHLELTHDLLTKVVQKSRDGRRERDRRDKLEREQAQREEQRRRQLRHARRLLAIAIAAAGVFFVCGALFTTISYRNANSARQEAVFIAEATNSLADDPERSLILAMYAIGATPDSKPELLRVAQELLHRVLLSSQVRLTLNGHQGAINSISVSADASRIITSGADRVAKLWDSESGRELKTYSGHQDNVVSAVFNADGKRVVTGSWDHTAKVWDTESGREIVTLKGHDDKVNSVAVNADGTQVATASADHTAKLWDVATGKASLTLRGHEGPVNGVAFSADGKRVATASADHSARIWDARTGKVLWTLERHENAVNSVAFSPDGTKLATAGSDHLAKIWDALSGRELMTLRGHKDVVTSVVFGPHGGRVATGSADKTAIIWDAGTGEELFRMRGHLQQVSGVSFSPRNDNRFGTSSWDKMARLWEIAGSEALSIPAHEGGTNDVAYSPDGKRLATGGEDSTVRIWDASTGKNLHTLNQGSPVNSLAHSPDGTRLASAGRDGLLWLWDTATGKPSPPFKGHTGEIITTAFSPDGKTIATASVDKTAKVWNTAGDVLLTFSGHKDKVYGVAFSSDGSRVITGGADNTARIWEAKTGREILVLRGHEAPVRSVIFSPAGKRIVTAGDDFTGRIWDAESGNLLFELRGHQSAIWSASFSPDGERVATSSTDKTSKIWDARTGRELISLGGHQGAVFSSVFSPDGKLLATASKDESVQVYFLELSDLMALARKRITRKLNRAECQEYFQSAVCPALP
jgi:WD40 repeat protein